MPFFCKSPTLVDGMASAPCVFHDQKTSASSPGEVPSTNSTGRGGELRGVSPGGWRAPVVSGRDWRKLRVIVKDETGGGEGSAPTGTIKQVAERDTSYMCSVKKVVHKIQIRC